MLSIGFMSAGQETYYTRLASARYYTESGEPQGTWWGEGAAAKGLTGEVKERHLENLMRGFSPNGYQRWVRNAGAENRRAGFDLTFSAEKSVSVAWALMPALRDGIERAHRAAVSGALDYLEREATRTRRGAQGDRSERAELMVAVFEHGSARAVEGSLPDPHLHSHCLTINTCVGTDGRTATLDGRTLLQHKMAAGVLYRARLHLELRRLGLEVARDGRWCRLGAVPEEVREEFSKRRGAIETFLQELGVSSAKASASAALSTRSNKAEMHRDALFPLWEDRGRKLGFISPERKVLSLESRESLLRGALPYVLEQLTEHKSYFSKQELTKRLAEAVEEHGAIASEVTRFVDAILPSLVPVGLHREGELYTTREMLALELSLQDTARSLFYRPNAVAAHHVDSVATRWTMSAEQERAFRSMTGGGSLCVISGAAGSGKTFSLGAAREAWELGGFTVRGAALAARAAKLLGEKSGIESKSIHRTLHEIERGSRPLSRNTALVIDEAAMVGTRLMERLVSAVAEAGAKLVLIGDEKQLPAIEAGAPFASLGRQLGASKLVENRRQRDQWAKDSAKDFSEGRAQQALSRFADRGLVCIEDDREKTLARLVHDWEQDVSKTSPMDTFVLTGTRRDSAEVNRAIQQHRIRAGDLDQDRFVRVHSTVFFLGDRVLFRRNSSLVNNGDSGTIVSVSADHHTITVKLDNEQRITIDTSVYQDIHLGYAGTTHASQGGTLKRCLVLCNDVMQDRESTYVQASRATDQTRFYMESSVAGDDLREVAALMERSRRKYMASDLRREPQAPQLYLEAA